MSEKEQDGAGGAKLKAHDCHFCGSTATRAAFLRVSDDFQGWQVECSTCGAMGPMNRPTEAEAINAWNIRPSEFRPTPTAEKADVVEAVAKIIRDGSRSNCEVVAYHKVYAVTEAASKSIARAAIAALQSRPAEPAGEEPVGEAAPMVGSNDGFTMAAFKASDVPAGTKLYARPATPSNPGRLVEALRDIRQAAQIAAAIEGEEDGETYAMIAARADDALSAPALDGENRG